MTLIIFEFELIKSLKVIFVISIYFSILILNNISYNKIIFYLLIVIV